MPEEQSIHSRLRAPENLKPFSDDDVEEEAFTICVVDAFDVR